MNDSKSIAEMIRDVDGMYLTQAEKDNAIARAEKAEAVMEFVSFSYSAVKKAFVKTKEYLLTGTQRQRQQA